MNQHCLIPSAPSLSQIVEINPVVNSEWEETIRYRYKKESEEEVSNEIKDIWETHDSGMAILNRELDNYKAIYNKKREELELKYFTLISKIDFLIPREKNNYQEKAREKIDTYQLLDGLEKDKMVIETFIEYEKKIADIENYLREASSKK